MRTPVPTVFTVSQLNSRIAGMIAADPELQMIFIEGELSNLRPNAQSGHLYFSLKDRNSVIRAVMFAFNARNLRFRPTDGMKVIVRAQVTVYEPMGQYQLRVEDMQPDGVGVLAMQLEQLKKKLQAEGLFDPAHKRPIPAMPQTVGVITSPTGAALRDIMDIIGRRWPVAQIVLAPVMVQGDAAPEQLIDAVNAFSRTMAADVVIIGRGGGSMEDLWAFNDEGLARAIYNCRIPVISAVGHETDVTICDFVSDLRAPTPSAAAELAVPNAADILANTAAMMSRAEAVVTAKLALYYRDLEKTHKMLEARSPAIMIEQKSEQLATLSLRMQNAAESKYRESLSAAQELFARLEALNPQATLNRGYAHIGFDGKTVSSVNDVKVGDTLLITLKDGTVTAIVTAE